MLVIFGISVSEDVLGVLRYVCETCGNEAAHRVLRRRRRFTPVLHPAVLGRHHLRRHLHVVRPYPRAVPAAGRAGHPRAALIDPSPSTDWPCRQCLVPFTPRPDQPLPTMPTSQQRDRGEELPPSGSLTKNSGHPSTSLP